MEEKDIEVITTGSETDLSTGKVKEINDLHIRVGKTLRKAALQAYELGQYLHEIQLRLPPNTWGQFVRDNFIFTLNTANTYLRVYEGFRDNPELLSDKSITGALEYLGKKPAGERRQIEYTGADNDDQRELDLDLIFAKPPVSKAKLENYRFECPNNRSLWLVKRGMNAPIKFLDIFTDPPGKDDLKHPHEAMLKSIQSAVELYFEKVEKIEKKEERG